MSAIRPEKPLSPADLIVRRHLAPNGDGWRLALKQTVHPATLDHTRRPLLIVPGYGMNAFIFGYHPRGLSMEASLALAGFEVWSANLRAQGESERTGGTDRYGLRELGLTDLGAAIDYTLGHCETARRDAVTAVGCSLGATLVYMQAALAAAPRIGAIVAMGGALRLDDVHPLVALLFRSPAVAGAIPLRGIRRLAALALPQLRRVPWLLSIYLHPAIVDLSRAEELARTVEDPNRHLNRELALWIRSHDLQIDGRNLTEEFAARVRTPLLSVVANADGIVPPSASLSAHRLGHMEVNDVLEVGTRQVPIAHADLFISDYAQRWVFNPIASWIAEEAG